VRCRNCYHDCDECTCAPLYSGPAETTQLEGMSEMQLETLPDPTIESIVERMRARSKEGIKNYGMTIRDNNSKSIAEWIDDAIEEAMDQVVYLTKLREVIVGYK
jgi:hypothetical protein